MRLIRVGREVAWWIRVRREWLARELGSAYPLLASIRRALDPLGIMNPGALLPDVASGRS